MPLLNFISRALPASLRPKKLPPSLAQIPIPDNEKSRLEAIKSYHLLEAEVNPDLNQVAQLAAQLCNAPIALIGVMEQDRHWFLAKVGTQVIQTPRSISFCAYTITGTSLLVVENLQKDRRFCHNPLVTGEPYLRFYAGMPLISPEGFALGSICVLDHKPRSLSKTQAKGLHVLARQLVDHLELRRKIYQYEKAKESLEVIAHWQSHQVRKELASIIGLLQLVNQQGLSEENQEYFALLMTTARKMDQHLTASLYSPYEQ